MFFYELECDFDDLKIKKFDNGYDGNIDWAMFIGFNRDKRYYEGHRKLYEEYDSYNMNYDLIIGPIANDKMTKCFSYLKDFILVISHKEGTYSFFHHHKWLSASNESYEAFSSHSICEMRTEYSSSKLCLRYHVLLTEQLRKYNLQYAKDSLKRVPLDVNRDYYDNILRPTAEHLGMSVNTFIKMCIDKHIRDLVDKEMLPENIVDSYSEAKSQ